MLTKISWKNVWRNKGRSTIVIISIALGLWAGTFMMAFSWGMSEQRVESAIKNEVSHIQIHKKGYERGDLKIRDFIPEGPGLLKKIAGHNEVSAVSGRTVVTGMASSTKGGEGIKIIGIDPLEENHVTHLANKLVSGSYFETGKRNPAFVGKKLADKLGLEEGSKFVLTFQDADNEITAGAFRVSGIYESLNHRLEGMNIYVKNEDLLKITGMEQGYNELAIFLHDQEQIPVLKNKLNQEGKDIIVEDWKEISPELNLIIESFGQSMVIFIGIILLALSFGIINTMLMAVLERTRELGMLMAIGMNKLRVFLMILLETFFLMSVGAPLGLLLGFATITFFGNMGIDLSVFSKGLGSYGFSPLVHPSLTPEYYLQIVLLVIIATVASAIYPALKALKLDPATAIRKL